MRWLILILLLFVVLLGYNNFFYFNVYTHSLPYGIYIKTKGTPQRGDYASSCLTTAIARYGLDRGYLMSGTCPTGTMMVLKIIKGLPGDYYLIKNSNLELNGVSYPIMKKDSTGRDLNLFYQKNEGTLKDGEYLLISTFAKNSWDSRYWGPVGIQFLLKPFWIFENVKK